MLVYLELTSFRVEFILASLGPFDSQFIDTVLIMALSILKLVTMIIHVLAS